MKLDPAVMKQLVEAKLKTRTGVRMMCSLSSSYIRDKGYQGVSPTPEFLAYIADTLDAARLLLIEEDEASPTELENFLNKEAVDDR